MLLQDHLRVAWQLLYNFKPGLMKHLTAPVDCLCDWRDEGYVLHSDFGKQHLFTIWFSYHVQIATSFAALVKSGASNECQRSTFCLAPLNAPLHLRDCVGEVALSFVTAS